VDQIEIKKKSMDLFEIFERKHGPREYFSLYKKGSEVIYVLVDVDDICIRRSYQSHTTYYCL